MSEREILTWESFAQASRQIACKLVDDDFIPDVVIAIARGGLIPAGAIAYALGVKAAGTLNVEFYSDIAETLSEPVVLEPVLDTAALQDKKLLVVDDVADSGKTLSLVLRLLSAHTEQVRSAVLYHKPSSIITPDYHWKSTDLWINFPWSSQPTVRGNKAH